MHLRPEYMCDSRKRATGPRPCDSLQVGPTKRRDALPTRAIAKVHPTRQPAYQATKPISQTKPRNLLPTLQNGLPACLPFLFCYHVIRVRNLTFISARSIRDRCIAPGLDFRSEAKVEDLRVAMDCASFFGVPSLRLGDIETPKSKSAGSAGIE